MPLLASNGKKEPIKSAMVSRLPKFGGRSSVGGTNPLSNGSTKPATPNQDGNSSSSGTQTNGVIRTSPFSLKLKKDEGLTTSSSTNTTSPRDGGENKAQPQLSSLAKDVKNGSPATPKMRRSGSLMLAVSSPKVIPKQSLMTSPKVGSKLGPSPLNGDPKLGPNGFESRLVRPRLGSSSPRSSSQDSLSLSSDGLKTLALENMVRSNSFTHFKQIPSPTNQPMTRSFSFNRAVELAKPLANTQLRPPRGTLLKPPQLSNGRTGLGLGSLNCTLGGSGGVGGGFGGLQCSRTPLAASSLPTLSIPPALATPSSPRKHLLPSCVLTKSVGYRLARSGQAKQQKHFLLGRAKGDTPSALSESEGLLGGAIDIEPTFEADKTDSHSDSDGSSGDGDGKRKGGESGVLTQSSDKGAGESLEDMSLSSASSLDRGDNSEEFFDDFYSMRDVLSDGDLPDNKNFVNSSQTQSLHSFISETLDWDNMDLEVHKKENPTKDSKGPLFLCPNQSDALQASSVELSPSNSSGGTYMWDEDGLEPLEGPGTHPYDSYDNSDLNSTDILNNLDPLGTGELDDDDLMLDVDLPEDGFHADSMSHIEHLERASRQGQRRKHHRWSGPDHFHNNSRAHVLQPDGLKASRIPSRSVPSEGRQHDCMAMLDELTLEHISQDCSSLKNQLLRLRTLLQLEDTDSPPDVPVELEDNTTTSQLGELIKEVQVLRGELKSRDKTIAQLTLQCQRLQHQQEQMPAQGRQFGCHFHHQRAPSSLCQSDRQTDKRMQHRYDKATQTYWRPPSHAGVQPTQLLSLWQAQHQGLTRTSMPQRRHTSNTTAFQPLPQRAPPPGKTSKNSPHRGPQ